MNFDSEFQICSDLKLCDFGLSIKFKEKTALSDFCGSPGFFAPEMITRGSYFGDKADVWSTGCILLELVLGHEKFCDTWMVAYDYETLQEKETFGTAISESVRELPQTLNFSSELNDFVLKFLNLKSSERPTITSMLAHAWLSEVKEEGQTRPRVCSTCSDISEGLLIDVSLSPMRADPVYGSLSGSYDMTMNGSFSPEPRAGSKEWNANPAEVLKDSYSDRERKFLEDYNHHHIEEHDSDHIYNLPPIEPPTPSVGHARKILQKGESLAQKVGAASSLF